MGNEQDFSKIIDNIKNTEIKKSKIHGNGLYATKKIKKDTVLCILDGQFISYETAKKDLELEWNQINNDIVLVRIYPTKYRFINHSRNPNLRLFREPLRVVSISDIEIGEELSLDYREEELGDQYLLDKGLGYL